MLTSQILLQKGTDVVCQANRHRIGKRCHAHLLMIPSKPRQNTFQNFCIVEHRPNGMHGLNARRHQIHPVRSTLKSFTPERASNALSLAEAELTAK